MSRLDSFIGAHAAQRDCLNFLKPAIDSLTGPISKSAWATRTYDHLRTPSPAANLRLRAQVAAHPDCIPPDNRLLFLWARRARPSRARRKRLAPWPR